MKKLLALLAASGIATVITAGAALAQSPYPASVVGTWLIVANNTKQFTFTVQSQSTDSPCAQIAGILPAPSGTNDTILGYYCPATGGLSFERNASTTGATFQVFTGNVSSTGSTTQFTGTFTNYAGAPNTGAFPFSASIAGL